MTDASALDASDRLFGFPPVYYQNAPDFESAGAIPLVAGQTQTVALSLVRQRYYTIKMPVVMAVLDGQQNGVNVSVYAHGRKGPGFSLDNGLHHAIEGMLPDGTYTVEASSLGPNGVSGTQTITIKGAPGEWSWITLFPGGLFPFTLRRNSHPPNALTPAHSSSGPRTDQE